MKKCLKDEATAKRVEKALDSAGIATANWNKEIGLREAAEKQTAKERKIADDRLVRIIVLEQANAVLKKRPTMLKLGLIVIGSTIVGVGVGIVAGLMIK